MAPRRRPGTRIAVLSETPTWAASPGADAPPFDPASSHMARDRRRRRVSGCRAAVPAVAERRRGHLARRQARLRPAAGGHVAHPHLSHSQPSGHLNPVSRPLRPHRPGTWPAGRGGRPSPPDLPAPRVAHRAPLPRPLFPGTMARHGRRCVTCDYEAHWGAFSMIFSCQSKGTIVIHFAPLSNPPQQSLRITLAFLL